MTTSSEALSEKQMGVEVLGWSASDQKVQIDTFNWEGESLRPQIFEFYGDSWVFVVRFNIIQPYLTNKHGKKLMKTPM